MSLEFYYSGSQVMFREVRKGKGRIIKQDYNSEAIVIKSRGKTKRKSKKKKSKQSTVVLNGAKRTFDIMRVSLTPDRSKAYVEIGMVELGGLKQVFIASLEDKGANTFMLSLPFKRAANMRIGLKQGYDSVFDRFQELREIEIQLTGRKWEIGIGKKDSSFQDKELLSRSDGDWQSLQVYGLFMYYGIPDCCALTCYFDEIDADLKGGDKLELQISVEDKIVAEHVLYPLPGGGRRWKFFVATMEEDVSTDTEDEGSLPNLRQSTMSMLLGAKDPNYSSSSSSSSSSSDEEDEEDTPRRVAFTSPSASPRSMETNELSYEPRVQRFEFDLSSVDDLSSDSGSPVMPWLTPREDRYDVGGYQTPDEDEDEPSFEILPTPEGTPSRLEPLEPVSTDIFED